jgi:hypothetical protein
MSGDSYRIADQHATYFLTITIVNWTALFIRKRYKDIIVNSLNYCIEKDVNFFVMLVKHFGIRAWEARIKWMNFCYAGAAFRIRAKEARIKWMKLI